MSHNLRNLKTDFLQYTEIEKGRSLNTVRNYDQYLSRFLDYTKLKDPKDITDNKVRDFRIWLNRQEATKEKGVAPTTLKKRTQNYYLIALRAFLKYLARQGISSLSPDRIELAKVPETILSRCQVFSFRKPTEKILAEMVTRIAEQEKVVVDAESAILVAFLGDGSFRDTYSILQKVFSAAKGRTVTRELVETVTGAPSLSLLQDLYTALIDRNIDAAYATLGRATTHHTDMMLLAQLLLDTMRHSLMYRYSPAMRTQLESEHGEQYMEIIKRGAVENIETISSRGIVSLITAIERIAYASIPALPLELAFIEMTGVELKAY
jgi:hypothetical protein